MMIRNSFASFSTSRLKMLPDNYSGSKLDTKKPSVKMSARHHHHLCRLYTTRSRRVFLCVIINARTNKHIRETDEKIKRIDSPPNISKSNFLFLSSFKKQLSLSLSSSRSLKKERTTKTKALKAANNTLSLFLPYFFMFLYTNTYRGKILFYCVCFSSNESKKTLNTQALKSRSPKRPV